MESPEFWLDAGLDGSLISAMKHDHNSSNPVTDGIAFSNTFVVSYQWTLVCFTIICSVSHWSIARGQKERIRRRQARMKQEDNAVSKDIDIAADETVALLPRRTSQRRGGRVTFIIRKVKAMLMYQPTLHPDIQPGSTTILMLFLLAINIFYLVYKVEFTLNLIMIFADRAGLMFVANLPWLYLLSAKNQPFRSLTGLSYENLNIIHRGLGKWMAALAIFHAIGMVVVWYAFLLPRGLDIWWYLSLKIIWIGLVAFFSYQTLLVTSHVLFRKWWYEMFLGCHIVFQIVGLIFLFLHHSRSRIYVGIALSTFLADRTVYRLFRKTRSFDADLTVLEDGKTVMMSASWPLLTRSEHRWYSIFGRSDLRYGWDAADHVFLTIPSMGKKHVIQAHPFTIASAAPEADAEHAWFNLLIRGRDGFTMDLLRHAEQHHTAKIRLDGPYGSTNAFNMLESHDISIVVAGGSGIAVAYPLLWKLLHSNKTRFGASSHRVRACLIWIVHDASHIQWLGDERLHELEILGLKLVVPPATSKAGRPDIQCLIKDSIAELKGCHDGESVGVIVSGPGALNRSVRNICADMAWRGENVDVAVEVFDW